MSQDRDDTGVDARLRRALASAPDAQVQPPAALDEAILRAAHAALPKPAKMSVSRESRGFFASLKRWCAHPGAAPVFAVLALSTVIVSMWTRHGVPSPTTDEDAPGSAVTPAREVAKAPPPASGGDFGAASPLPVPAGPAAPAAPAPAPAPSSPKVDTLLAPVTGSRSNESAKQEKTQVDAKAIPTTPTPRVSPSRDQTLRDGADSTTLADKKAGPAPRPKEAVPRRRQEAAAARRDAERDEPVVTAQDAREVATAPAPAVAVAPASPPPSAAPPADEGRAAAGAPAVAKAAAVGSVASTATPSAAFAPNRDASRLAAADAPALERMLDAAATWQWRSDPSQPPAAIDDRARAWFARLMAATQGRWVRVDPVPARSLRALPPEGAGPTWERPVPEAKARRSPDAQTFEVWREQTLWATIVVGASDVTWLDASGRVWRAALAADALAGLRSW